MALLTEADTCRKFVLPKLYAAGWTDDQISEQRSFTDGRIVVAGNKASRRPQKRADYLLRYRRDFTIATVEAKAAYKKPGDGIQQAKDYAQILGLKFAYSTNGHGIVEHDFLTGKDTDLGAFPTPNDLWLRLRDAEGISAETADRVLAPYYHLPGKNPRYYQEIAINRAVQAIAQGRPRVLLTLATGTGKTLIAFQICWKLWNSGWNRTGESKQTAETALLFLQLIMRKLRRPVGGAKVGRCGMVVPNGVLFGDGVCARIKEELLKGFNLHTIVRLPKGVFSPYTDIPTNLLFFDRSGPTTDIWFYEHPLPEGRKTYTKTNPLRFDEFEPCLDWWTKRKENDQAWKVKVADILKYDERASLLSANLDIKNPSAKEDVEQMPPEKLVEGINDKEERILALLNEIRNALQR